MNAVEVLERARRRIASGWTQEVAARDVSGKPVSYDAIEATRWCAIAAVWVDGDKCAANFLREALKKRRVGKDIATWNDAPGRKRAEVVKLFDDAIELAKKSAQKDKQVKVKSA